MSEKRCLLKSNYVRVSIVKKKNQLWLHCQGITFITHLYTYTHMHPHTTFPKHLRWTSTFHFRMGICILEYMYQPQ